MYICIGKLISQDVEKLKHENFTLRTKLENLKSVHELDIQNKGALIKQLTEKKAVC